jgi:adenylosuccinate synthase
MSNPGDIHVVSGGQFGSEAKGHVAAQLHERYLIDAAVRVGGPNAGHSAMDQDGRVWALRTIPVAAVVDPDCDLYIASGSEIDIDVLNSEIEMLEAAGHRVRERLNIDCQATMLDPLHIQQEQNVELQERFGSTAKGIGAARADRLMRKALIAAEVLDDNILHPDTATHLQSLHEEGANILIEGTQGYGLGLHAGYYPYCTSNDCAAIDFVAACHIQPHKPTDNWVVFRTYPIRVAGNSGPMYAETDWETLGAVSGGYIREERTTVTKKVRRVGQWDYNLAHDALLANGGLKYPRLHPVLTFVDYLDPDLAGKSTWWDLQDSDAWQWIVDREAELSIEFEGFTTSNHTIIWR